MTSEVPYHDEDDGQANATYHFKILVPSVAAGAIIGRGGETIAHLQQETRAKVKMSKATDFYPGTTERVCLITGSVEAILRLLEFIMLKILERPDPDSRMATDFDHKRSVGREKQVKILVPNSTAAMIIGRSGSYIKKIKQESCAYIQISQIDKQNFTLAERCITVIGDIESNKIACHMILAKIVKDPNSGSCSFISYANVTGPVPNFDPVGSPFASLGRISGGSVNSSNNSYDSNASFDSLSPPVANNFRGLQTSATTHPGIVPFTGIRMGGSALPIANIPQLIETIKTMLAGHGYSDQAVSEISAAMNILANYGLLGLDLGILINAPAVSSVEMTMPTSAPICPISSADMENQDVCASATDVPEVEVVYNSATTDDSVMESYSNMFSPTDSLGNEMSDLGLGPEFNPPTIPLSNDRLLMQNEAASFDPFYNRASPALVSPNRDSNFPANTNFFEIEPKSSFELPSFFPSDRQKRDTMKICFGVRENVVGAIIGPEGKAIADISQISGASIKISNKGVYAPGTRNRIVTISGTSNAVGIAQYLIERQVAQEEEKRAQRNAAKLLQ